MVAGLTLADLARPSERRLACFYDAALIVGGSLAIALCAQIAVGYPVPLTGQTLAVLLAGALLGARRGALCLLTYLAEGLLGLPVFAQGKAGLVAFLGPTGGYLLGFVAAAYLVGALAQRGWDRRATTTVLMMLLGDAVLYACGLVWLLCLGHFLGQPLGGRGVLAIGLYPFLPGEAVKIALAMALLPCGWKLIRRHFRLDQTPDIR